MSIQERANTARTPKALAIVLVAAIIALVAIASAQEPAKQDKPAATTNRYIGAEKCKNCHQADASGNQYAIWQKSAHAHAFERLASEEAKASGKTRGVDDPQKSEKCLKCHTTAFGAAPELVKKGFESKSGVQCESCHGPGEAHLKARFAAAAGATAEEGKPAARQVIPDGEIIVKIDQKTCLVCHNEESPNFKPFCFYEKYATMRHVDPRKAHDGELNCGCAKCACKNGCEPGCGVPAKK